MKGLELIGKQQQQQKTAKKNQSYEIDCIMDPLEFHIAL